MVKYNSESDRIPDGTVHRTIGLLKKVLIKLKAGIKDEKIEKIGIMVHRAMSMQNRSFHTPEHIFDLADPDDAHTTLAAIFHDVVYYQVDHGFQDEIEKVLRNYLIINGSSIKIKDEIDPGDRAFYGTAAVFGFQPGQILSPFLGLNEFLSALLMNSFLEGTVKDADLLIATAAIEMTIPFRNPDEEGRSPAQLLEIRIRKTNEKFNLNLSDEQIKNTVIAAVVLSNRDIKNFAEIDPGRFLDNTWKLLPETNPELFFHGLYTIRSYSNALMKMEGFLDYLKPEVVFQEFAGYPEKSEYETLIQRTSDNLKTAHVYLGIKMISAGILLALAELSGGDVPISFFMGESESEDEWCSLAYHLPDPVLCSGSEEKEEKEEKEETVIYHLLKYGRSESSDFDLQNSPLSLFIYCSMSEKELEPGIDISRMYIKGELDPLPYLEKMPGYLVVSIARAASFIAFTRKKRLREIAEAF